MLFYIYYKHNALPPLSDEVSLKYMISKIDILCTLGLLRGVRKKNREFWQNKDESLGLLEK
jgi:hypothetical protein